MDGILVLEDGTVYYGKTFGAKGERIGELVFNTAMTGYQEILTDPSYFGQIVVMTYPLIGNYGFNDTDIESSRPWVRGLVVKEMCSNPSNFRAQKDGYQYFKENNLIGIQGIDTRGLTQHIREKGSMMAVLSNVEFNTDILLKEIQRAKEEKINFVEKVSTKTITLFPGGDYKIAVLDFGVKKSILKNLQKMDFTVIVFPWNTPAEIIDKYKPHGILLSNGPSDPRQYIELTETINKLINKYPTLGICLGHQLLALTFGGSIEKMKFGHHGSNQPVKDLTTNKVYISSQNHNYNVLFNDTKGIEITHINVNDGSIEGFRHKNLPVISVQYHPEGAPGPNENNNIFVQFKNLIISKFNNEDIFNLSSGF